MNFIFNRHPYQQQFFDVTDNFLLRLTVIFDVILLLNRLPLKRLVSNEHKDRLVLGINVLCGICDTFVDKN